MVSAPTSRVAWPETHRLVMSRFPPIDLFDDVADPRDWEALALAQSRTNPRLYDEIGDLALVPVERRLSGQGASWVMAAFTHVSPHRVSRFSDGSYGIYYAANSLETALYEHTFHMARFYSGSGVGPGWLSHVRQLVGSINADLTDVRGEGFETILNPDTASYTASQAFAKEQKAAGANGIVYPSQRRTEGQCIAAFYPDVVSVARQADHFRYHWDGKKIDFVQRISGVRTMFQLG
jgi:RES domain